MSQALHNMVYEKEKSFFWISITIAICMTECQHFRVNAVIQSVTYLTPRKKIKSRKFAYIYIKKRKQQFCQDYIGIEYCYICYSDWTMWRNHSRFNNKNLMHCAHAWIEDSQCCLALIAALIFALVL